MATPKVAADRIIPPTGVVWFFLGVVALCMGLTASGVPRLTAAMVGIVLFHLGFFVSLGLSQEAARGLIFISLPIDQFVRLGGARQLTYFYAVVLLMMTNQKKLMTLLKRQDPIVGMILVIFAWSLIACSWSIDPWSGFLYSCTLGVMMIAYLGPACIFPDRAALHRAFGGLAIGSCTTMMIFLALLPQSAMGKLGTVKGNLAGTDSAIHLAVPAVTTLYLASVATGKQKVIALAAVALLSVGTVMVASRSGIAALMIGVLFTQMFAASRKKPVVRLLGVALTLFAAVQVAESLSDADIQGRFDQTANADTDLNTALTGRLTLWTVASTMIQRNPAIGIGTGAFAADFDSYLDSANMGAGMRGKQLGTHNIILRVAAENGLPAGLLFVAFLLMLLRAAWQERWEGAGLGGLAIGLTAATIVLLCFSSIITYMPWLGIGLAAFLREQRGRRNAVKANTLTAAPKKNRPNPLWVPPPLAK